MAFPDSNINVNNQGGTVTTGSGSNSVGSASGTTKPTIQDLFNMKRADVGEKYGQAGLDLFDKESVKKKLINIIHSNNHKISQVKQEKLPLVEYIQFKKGTH